MTDKLAVPTPKVDPGTIMPGGDVANIMQLHDMSIVGLFMQADIVVKLVVFTLVLASFWSWKIIIEKFLIFREIKQKMADFEGSIWSGELLEKHYEKLKQTADHPIAKVFVAGMYEWVRAKKKDKGAATTPQTSFFNEPKAGQGVLQMQIKERIFHAMDASRNREISELEKDLGFLATVGSTAPFVGLFGTVWGIMNSFTSIAMSKNSTLAVVAPGIAEALFATAIGLFAAIPAVIFYNKFSNNVANFSDRLDAFSDDFGSIVSRELDI